MSKYVNVIFTPIDWSIDPRKHLYKEILDKTKYWSKTVIVQHPIGIIGHFFTKFKQKILGLIIGKYKTKKLNDNIIIFTPIILFHYGFWINKSLLSSLDICILTFQVNKFVEKNYKSYKKILWCQIPQMAAMLSKLRYDFLIYDLQDNVDYNSQGLYLVKNAILNNKLIQQSNMVISTSTILYEKSRKINSNVLLLTNGNDYKTLSIKVDKDFNNEISDIKKPIIGYIGGIRDWLNFNLINLLINQMQDVFFVFIGMIYRNGKKDFNNIIKYSNVVWINYKEQKDLPHYMRKFSVGIIPFKVNEFMKGVFPNKFFEYMACEVPIVTTALPELKSYSNIIGYSNNNDEFLNNCKLAVEGGFKDKIKFYPDIAFKNSWEKKAQVIDKTLRKKLNIIF